MAAKPKKVSREVGPEGQGSMGDMRDRFRDTYKPGAGPKMEPGLSNPIDQLGKLFKRKKRKKPAA